MQTFRSLFEPDCSSSFAHVLNALFPGTNQGSHTQAGMASRSTPQLPSLFFFSDNSLALAFPCRTRLLVGTFVLVYYGPLHREIHTALLKDSCDILVKAERQTRFITPSLSGVLFKSEEPRKWVNTSTVLWWQSSCSEFCPVYPRPQNSVGSQIWSLSALTIH